MTEDRHRGLKRYERSRQLAALDAEPNLVWPLALCRVHSRPEVPLASAPLAAHVPVYIVRVFAKDFVCVQAHSDTLPEGVLGPTWLVRGGIDWNEYLRKVVRHYSAGMPVPDSFLALKKIRPEIIRKMESLPNSALPAIFSRFREVGLLPALPPLERSTCPLSLTWDTLRVSFQDFLAVNNLKDNPPP